MSGRTGKLTAEALAKRGPRMVLASVLRMATHPDGPADLGFIIYQEGKSPVLSYPHNPAIAITTWAKSFNIKYLLRCAKTMESVV